MIVDALARRLEVMSPIGVRFIHCDHFEPFSVKSKSSSGAMELIRLPHVEEWTRLCQRSEHFRKATPFVLSRNIIERWTPGHPDNVIEVDDFLSFSKWEYSEEDRQILTVIDRAGLDFQLHIHHENWTESKRSGLANDPERDSRRLFAYAKAILDYFRSVSPKDVWLFVHGHWSLNGSDRTVCNVMDEISTLHKLGVVADFTFPPGRKGCAPSIDEPFTVSPVCTGPKCYDTDLADRQLVNTTGLDRSRFLVWSSPVPHQYCSLERIISDELPPAMVVDRWLDAPLVRKLLVVKTHAHSMNPVFWDSVKHCSPPIASRRVCESLNLLRDACTTVGIPYRTVSATELYRELEMA